MAQFRFSLAKLTTIALCALSLSVHGATETVPQFGASAYAKITDKPDISPDAITMSAWFKVTTEAGKGGDFDCIIGSSSRNSYNGPMTIYYNNATTAAKRGIGVNGKVDDAYKELFYQKDLADGAWHFVAATISGSTPSNAGFGGSTAGAGAAGLTDSAAFLRLLPKNDLNSVTMPIRINRPMNTTIMPIAMT